MSAGEGHSASFFFFCPVLPLARFLVPVSSGRIVSSPSRGSVAGGGVVALGDTPRRVGGVIWLLVSRPVPSSRSAARSISPYRLAGRMRAPFLSAHSPASFVGGWSYRFPFRLVPRLVCPSRGASRIYSLRFACRLVLLVNSPASYCPVSPGGSSLSLPVLFIVPWCLVFAFHLAGVSLFRLARSSRQAVRVLSFRPGGSSRRLVWRGVFSLSPVSFSSVLVLSRLLRFMDMGIGSGSSCSCLVAVCFFPCCHPSSLRSWRWRNGRAVRRYGGTRRFIQLVSPSGKDDEGRYG